MEKIKYITWNETSSKTIVLIHGYADDATMFEPLSQFLPTYKLIAINLPMNLGTDQQYNIEKLTKYTNNVLKQLQVRSYILVGFSLGGLIAIDLASKNKIVKRLVLLNSYPYLVGSKLLKVFLYYGKRMLTTRPILKIISSFVTSDFARRFFKAPHINADTLTHMKNDYISVFGSLLNCVLYNGLVDYKTLNIPKHVILFKDDSVLNYEIYQAYAKTDNLEIHTQCKGGHHETTQYWPEVATTLATLLK